MKLMERKYISRNGVVERTRYAVGDNAKPRRGKKRGNTSFRKQEANFNAAVRRVARILNCNYSHDDGLLVTLDYSPEGLARLIDGLPEQQRSVMEKLRLPLGRVGEWMPANAKGQGEACAPDSGIAEAMDALRKAAEHQMTLWLRRVRRKYGQKMKALMVTSDIDGDTGELVRVHHHLPISAAGISWDMLRREWKHGSVDIAQLRSQPDYTPIAVYLLRQVRRQPDAKKYRVTRGMELPEVEEREILSGAEIRTPPGALVFERSEFSAETLTQYVRYLPRRAQRHNRGGGGCE